eukprot:6196144-Prorocentrum_lima.AAC.1
MFIARPTPTGFAQAAQHLFDLGEEEHETTIITIGCSGSQTQALEAALERAGKAATIIHVQTTTKPRRR